MNGVSKQSPATNKGCYQGTLLQKTQTSLDFGVADCALIKFKSLLAKADVFPGVKKPLSSGVWIKATNVKYLALKADLKSL